MNFEKLDKVRSQINSKLDNQKQLALILQTIEENMLQQGQKKTPVSYFVSFLTLLDQCCQDNEIKDYALAAGAVYFLNIVAPEAPKALLRNHFSDILIKLSPALSSEDAEAAMVRSSVGFLESLLLAQDTSSWNNANNYKISPRRGLMGLLELGSDPRPKVRKRAQEAVHTVLANPPPGPTMGHPAAPFASEVALNSLISLMQDGNKADKSQVTHALQLISSVASANSWPEKLVSPLCDVLLEVCKSSDQHLIASSFSAFEGLFSSMTDEFDSEKFEQVLNIIFDLKPSINDPQLAPAWLAVVAKAVSAYAQNINSQQCLAKLPAVFKMISKYFQSTNPNVYTSASQCLIAITTDAISEQLLLAPPAVSMKQYEETGQTIEQIAKITLDLLSVRYSQAAKEVAELLMAIFDKLKIRANPDFLDHLKLVGDWRSEEKEGFDLNQVSENVIAAAIRGMGPESVLDLLPLNLDQPKATGRAWLLPILRDNVRCAQLEYYKTRVVPVIGYFEQVIAKGAAGSVNSKIFATIIDQIWSLLPPFCDLPTDLPVSFTTEFAAHLSELLYKQVELRPTICHALRLLVESNEVYGTGEIVDPMLNQQFPPSKAKENVEFLSKQIAPNLLSVLFNVFSQTPMDQRNYILDTIDRYLSISQPEDLYNTFNKVCGLLKGALDEEKPNTSESAKTKVPSLGITMMDLIVQMAKYLPEKSHNALFAIFNQTLQSPDAQIQKRAYRILTRLMETEEGTKSVMAYINEISKVLSATANSTAVSSKAVRLESLLQVVKNLPVENLYFIPAILSETIIGTKNDNTQAREAAYDILIEMAKKLQANEGAVIKNSQWDPDMADSEASLKEFFVMCSAGLAGSSPHMVSATITAISRIFFEFRDQLPQEFLQELASTVNLFLTSKNREIIKSTLGFVKVAALTQPEDIVRPEIPGLLTTIMSIDPESKAHFRVKIKHLIERLIRKFGLELVEQGIPEEDRKLISNIRKSQARAKRKKAEGVVSTAPAEKRDFMSAYDEALYNSDSEQEDEEEPEERGNARYISESKDDPLDLLDKQALSHISSTRPRKFTKKESEYQTKNGKLVFDEENDNLSGKNSIDAYVEAVKQAPVRGLRNKLHYKKEQRRADGIDWENDPDEDSRPARNADYKRRDNRRGGDHRGDRRGGDHRGGDRGRNNRGRGGYNRSRGGGRDARGGRVGKPERKFKARRKL